MASPLTANFLKYWRGYTSRKGHLAVKVELTSPSGLTVRVADMEIQTTDGTYEAAIERSGPVVAPGSFLESRWSPCSFDFTLKPPRLSVSPLTHSSIHHLFAAYRWHGAVVTAYFWEETAQEFAQMFKGVVIDYQTDGLGIRVSCQQRTDWNIQLPSAIVDRSSWPRAPEASIGMPAGGILYGNLRGAPMRSPVPEYGVFEQGLKAVAGPRHAVRGTVVSAGRGNGGEKGLVLFASHALKTFEDETKGCSCFYDHMGTLCDLDPKGGDTVNAASPGTGFYIDDESSGGTDPFTLFFPLLPTDSRLAAANNADNPRGALEALTEYTYTHLDYDAGLREATFRFSSVAPPGTMRDIRYVVGYRTSAAANKVQLTIDFGTGTSSYAIPASTSITAVTAAIGTTWGAAPTPTVPYDFGSRTYKVEFNGVATGQTADIFFVGIAVRFRPDGTVLRPKSTKLEGVKRIKERPGHTERYGIKIDTVTIPEIVKLDMSGTHYATVEGYADDGGGTYTDIASALIERGPDIARHLLETYLGQSGKIEIGSSSFGSFKSARSELSTWRKSDMVNGVAVTDFTPASDILDDLSRSMLGWIYLSRFDDKWHDVTWKAGKSVDYDLVISKEDLANPERDFSCATGFDDVTNDLDVPYAHDDYTRKSVHSTFIGPSRSSSGHKYRQLRDQNTTVTASLNDRINFGSNTATLAAAAYDMAGLIQEAQSKMRSADGANTIAVTWGYLVISGWNDTIDCKDHAAVTQVATLTSGLMTAEQRAADVQAAIRTATADNTWTCTYSRTTRKFTIDRPSASVTGDKILFSTGTNKTKSAGPMLGYNYVDFTANAIPSDNETEEERIGIAFATARDIKWETGADGINSGTPRSAASLFGHDPTRDRISANFHQPDSPKNSLEISSAASASRYGFRRRRTFDIPYVYDSDTAREIRNRLAALLFEPRIRVSIKSERMPDIERGRVISFDSSLDSVFRYPGIASDGSWAGKRFMVFEVIQHTGPVFETEVQAVEIS